MTVWHIINPPLAQITNQCLPRHRLLPNTNPNPNLSFLPPSPCRSHRTLRQPSPHRHRLTSSVPPTCQNSLCTFGNTRTHAATILSCGFAMLHAENAATTAVLTPERRHPSRSRSSNLPLRVAMNPVAASSSSRLHLLQLLSHLYLLQLPRLHLLPLLSHLYLLQLSRLHHCTILEFVNLHKSRTVKHHRVHERAKISIVDLPLTFATFGNHLCSWGTLPALVRTIIAASPYINQFTNVSLSTCISSTKHITGKMQ